MVPFARVPLSVFQVGLVFAWSSGYVGAIIAADTGSIVRVLVWRFIGVSKVDGQVVAEATFAAMIRDR